MIGKTISRYHIVEKLGIAVSASALVVARHASAKR